MAKKKEHKITECHCGNLAVEYRSRSFINQLNKKVIRTFYRCVNCWSRIHSDETPEVDKMDSINIIDVYMNPDKYRDKFRNFED